MRTESRGWQELLQFKYGLHSVVCLLCLLCIFCSVFFDCQSIKQSLLLHSTCTLNHTCSRADRRLSFPSFTFGSESTPAILSPIISDTPRSSLGQDFGSLLIAANGR
ncbi:hypothetical protein BDV12DRAFT_161115 [Aspergillus spectabilis]